MLDSLSSSFTSSPLLQYVDTFNMCKSLLLLKSKCNGLIGVWLRHMYRTKSASLLLLKSSHSINKTVIDRGVKFSWKWSYYIVIKTHRIIFWMSWVKSPQVAVKPFSGSGLWNNNIWCYHQRKIVFFNTISEI